MTDKKISALPDAATLSSGDQITLLQGGANVKTPVSQVSSFTNSFTDVWSQGGSNPAAVTDWGPIINTLITNGAKKLQFRNHDFPFTTTLNFNDTRSVSCIGAGRVWPGLNGSQAASRLLWKGTGSGNAITANGADGLTFREMGVYYDNAAFTGRLLSARAGGGGIYCAGMLIDNCFFGSTTSAINSAFAILALGGTVGVKVTNSSICGGQWLVRGIDQLGDLSNAVYFDNVQLGGFVNAALTNIGLQWGILNCTIEFPDGSSTSAGIDNDVACLSQFTVDKCGFWDKAFATQIPIRQRANGTWAHASFTDNYFDIFNATHFQLDGPGSIYIRGNQFSAPVPEQAPTLVDLGNATTALKKAFYFGYNNIGGSTFVETAILNVNGHENVTIEGHAQLATIRELHTITGQERVGYIRDASFLPSIAVHSGQTLGVCEIRGSDIAGYVIIRTGGSPSSAGLILDITFSASMIPFPSAITSAERLPAIQLTPLALAGPNASGTASVDAGAYVQLDSAQRSGFQIGTKNIIPAFTTLAYSYRVIQL